MPVVYKPNKYIEEGKSALWRQMLLDVRNSYELGWQLFLRDFLAKYKQALLGVLWLFITPVFGALVFVVMNKAGILSVSDTGIPYPIYALYGSTVWSLFAGMLASFTMSIRSSGVFIAKINFPRIALVYSPILASLADFIVRVLLLFIISLLFGVKLAYVWLFPVLILPFILFSIGIGFFLSLIGAVFADTQNFVSIGLNVLMFLSPIMYPIKGDGLLATANRFNPLNYFVSVPRDILFSAKFENLGGYFVFAALSLLLFGAGWQFYQVAVARITEKI